MSKRRCPVNSRPKRSLVPKEKACSSLIFCIRGKAINLAAKGAECSESIGDRAGPTAHGVVSLDS